MKKSASEIIRELELRVSQLESTSKRASALQDKIKAIPGKMNEISEQMVMLEKLYRADVIPKPDYDSYINELLNRVDNLEAEKASLEQMEASLDPSVPKVGDILYSSWGYGMTIVDFFKVIKVSPSGKSITLQELESDIVEGSGYDGYKMPSKHEDRRKSPIKNKRVSPGRDGYSVKINQSANAYKWDGKKKYFNTLD